MRLRSVAAAGAFAALVALPGADMAVAAAGPVSFGMAVPNALVTSYPPFGVGYYYATGPGVCAGTAVGNCALTIGGSANMTLCNTGTASVEPAYSQIHTANGDAFQLNGVVVWVGGIGVLSGTAVDANGLVHLLSGSLEIDPSVSPCQPSSLGAVLDVSD